MINKISFIFIVCVIFTTVLFCCAQELSSNECRELGFSSNTLLCSSCDELKEFKLTELGKSCRKCCIPDRNEADLKKYSKAVLQVCNCNLARYPQVQAFIHSDRVSKYPNLKVEHVRGKIPTLVLYDEHGDEVDSLGVDQWTTDTVEEYLNQILLNQ